MATIAEIQEHPVYKQIIQDSLGGILYNVANKEKYDVDEIVQMWDSLDPSQQTAAGGIMEGAFNFIKEI